MVRTSAPTAALHTLQDFPQQQYFLWPHALPRPPPAVAASAARFVPNATGGKV